LEQKYNPIHIETKWQEFWEENRLFSVHENADLPKFYCLEMFPYPSGRIHMGHVRNYVIGDVITRYKKMRGFNVLHPMGWDAFGMPAENAAIKHGMHPSKWTYDNIDYMRRQLKKMGLGYDWQREVATCNPGYYKWNQWFFIKMLEQGLAYKKSSSVNWCPSCETVLANEQVIDEGCWRCDSTVTQKELEQWFFRITDYAEELLKDADTLTGWPEKVVTMQRNWIGRSEGVEVDFNISGTDRKMRIFTTRQDTLYGTTFMSIARTHPLVTDLVKDEKILKAIISLSDDPEEKEGVFTGFHAENPLTGKEIPVYVANFVLMEYGTGAVMAVPAHDQRDFEFAKKYDLPIDIVIEKEEDRVQKSEDRKQNREQRTKDSESLTEAFEDYGILVESAQFSGLSSKDAREQIAEYLEKEGMGRKVVNYKLRDWGISRQRYWGCPVPVIHTDDGEIPVQLLTVKPVPRLQSDAAQQHVVTQSRVVGELDKFDDRIGALIGRGLATLEGPVSRLRKRQGRQLDSVIFDRFFADGYGIGRIEEIGRADGAQIRLDQHVPGSQGGQLHAGILLGHNRGELLGNGDCRV